jgi:putative transposase
VVCWRTGTKNAGAVFFLKHPIVWVRNTRRPVLVPPVDARLKKLLTEIAKQHGMTRHAVEMTPDHGHIFVESDTTRRAAKIVNRFKGRTSRILRQEFPQHPLPARWNGSYFAATAGAVIEAQKGV